MLIYKAQLPIDTWDFKTLKLTCSNAETARKAILKLGIQHDIPCVWYQVDADTNAPEREFLLFAIGTGHDWGDQLKREEYIGSLLLMNESLVLHYFLVDSPEGQKKRNTNEQTL